MSNIGLNQDGKAGAGMGEASADATQIGGDASDNTSIGDINISS